VTHRLNLALNKYFLPNAPLFPHFQTSTTLKFKDCAYYKTCSQYMPSHCAIAASFLANEYCHSRLPSLLLIPTAAALCMACTSWRHPFGFTTVTHSRLNATQEEELWWVRVWSPSKSSCRSIPSNPSSLTIFCWNVKLHHHIATFVL
jgi:hypothetical protein